MTENLLIPQDYTTPTVEPCPKCGSAHWIHEEKGFNLDRMECLECHTSIWGFSGMYTEELALATWNALSKERQRIQTELSATKDKLAKAEVIVRIIASERFGEAVDLSCEYLAELMGDEDDD